jgi:hypothetical protein
MNRLWSISAAVSVTLCAIAGGSVWAAPIIIDDGDPGFDTQGGIYPGGTPAGTAYNDHVFWTNNTQSNAWAYWQFTGLTPGTYDIHVTWQADRAWWDPGCEAAPFSVIDGGVVKRGWPDNDVILAPGATGLADIDVNQSVNPAGLSYAGLNWFYLGSFTITGDTLTVMVTNQTAAAGPIVADAVMIEAAIPEPASLALLALGTMVMVVRRR